MMNELDFVLKSAYNEAKSEMQSSCQSIGGKLLEFSVSKGSVINGITKMNATVKIDINGMKKDEIVALKSSIEAAFLNAYVGLLDRGHDISAGNLDIITVGKAKGLFW